MAATDGTGRKRKFLSARVAIWALVGVLIVVLAVGGGFYLWFRSQVGASNSRVSQDVLDALHETTTSSSVVDPSTTTTLGATTTTASVPTVSTGPTTTEPVTTTETVDPPTGMNILVLGSDTRAGNGTGGRSDTIIIVHVDSEKNYVSLLSIPRDLMVEIPGHGTNKINAAYAYGGPALVIRTVKAVFKIKLDHFMEVDFNAFKTITDSLGGVYVDVDRVYDDGLIQFQPGYQLLDGTNALRFVRHRHDSNFDFGRMERQQRFLNAVREQAMGWNLPLKLPGFIKGLFGNVDTDLTANQFLSLAYWGVKLDGGRMRQAKFTGGVQTIDGKSYVVASAEQISRAVKDFNTEPPAVPEEDETVLPASTPLSSPNLTGVSVTVVNASGRVGQGALAATWLLRQGAKVVSVEEAADPVDGYAFVTYPSSRADAGVAVAEALGLPLNRQGGGQITVTLTTKFALNGEQIPVAVDTSTGTPAPAAVLDPAKWSALAGQTPLALVAPVMLPQSVRYSFQRGYAIKVDGKDVPAVRVGYRFRAEDVYMGISATTWLDAPIAAPGRKVKGPGGVVYRLVGSATKTDHIWWERDGVLYWVSNTLTYDLQREEMLATAMSALPVTPGR